MFEPWVGNRFGQPNVVGGCRLLILGESHYTKEVEKIGTTPDGFTTEILRHFAIEGRHAFFGKLQEIVTGRPRGDQTFEDKRAFWDAVAFYNYVPVIVDGRDVAEGGGGRRPTHAMFEAGAEPYQAIKRRIEPDAVVVCGLTLWNYVAPTLAGFSGLPRDVIFYDDGTAVHARIEHPSYREFSSEKWYGRMRRLIELSAEPRQLGRRIVWQSGD